MRRNSCGSFGKRANSGSFALEDDFMAEDSMVDGSAEEGFGVDGFIVEGFVVGGGLVAEGSTVGDCAVGGIVFEDSNALGEGFIAEGSAVDSFMADNSKPEGEGVEMQNLKWGARKGGFRDCRRCIEFAL
ncbi:uncharacterized protein PAC_00382 [Phialocephala subalpina]|uniref:Uncharacterized protein n=1 Tax=Phialocephala subalpina TaxID=576137 RepID=A0A1L7WCU6_9HELO|nr:uncharacterized protein PAC_00382 [Phialocephala subalpina]